MLAIAALGEERRRAQRACLSAEAEDFPAALRIATAIVEYGGEGHTASLFTAEGDPENRALALQVRARRFQPRLQTSSAPFPIRLAVARNGRGDDTRQ